MKQWKDSSAASEYGKVRENVHRKHVVEHIVKG